MYRFLGLLYGVVLLMSGCSTTHSGYQRDLELLQFPVQHSQTTNSEHPSGQRLSLYGAISGAVNNIGGRIEKRAALKAYNACRTSTVFVNYHVRQIYRDLYSGITLGGVELTQQQGFIFVSIPIKGAWPDPYILKQVASVVGQNEHIFVFLPDETPFGRGEHQEYLGRLKNALADYGIQKDHIRVLPMDLFSEQQGEKVAHNSLLPLKLCYG